jgi:hypothetical protein
METKICSSCKNEKPLMSFYRTKYRYVDGRSKHQHECITCKGKSMKLSKEDAQKQLDFILNKTTVAIYRHYIVTIYDEQFNEYVGTISARLYFDITSEMFGVKEFNIDDKRLFYEAKVDNLSADEYYTIHNRGKDQKGLGCPNITIIKTMSKKDVKVALHEFLTALYFYHNKC